MNDSILFTRTETASAPPLFTRRSEFLPLALIVVCTVVALSPLMQAVFVWDDDRYITNNTTLHTLDGFEKIWTRPSSMPDPYPLVMTAFWAMYQIWSDNAPFYHAVNITLHTLNAYLLWLLLRRLGIPGALLAALIFAVHPMHVESVAHISELKDVMSGLFYFLTLHAWLRFRGTGRQEHYYHAVILYACAMMSKTVTCSLPPTLILLLWWKPPADWKKQVLLTLPLFMIALVLGAVSVWWERTYTGAYKQFIHHDFAQRILIAGRAIWFYAGKILWPSNLTLIYPKWEIDVHEYSQFVWPVAALAAPFLLLTLRSKGGRGAFAAVIYSLITLGPALGFFDFSTMYYSYVADHYQYLGSIGIIVLFSAVATRVSERTADYLEEHFIFSPLSPRIRSALGFLSVLALALSALLLGMTYRDSEIFYRRARDKNPTSPHPHYDLGVVLLSKSNQEGALKEFNEALRLEPNYTSAYLLIAQIMLTQGDRAKAKGYYEWAARTHAPNAKLGDQRAAAYTNLGMLLMQEDNYDGATDYFLRALEITPHSIEAHLNLALIRGKQRNYAEAAEHCMEVIKVDPKNASAFRLLGLARLRQDKIDAAIDYLKRAVELRPDFSAAQQALEEAVAAKEMRDSPQSPPNR